MRLYFVMVSPSADFFAFPDSAEAPTFFLPVAVFLEEDRDAALDLALVLVLLAPPLTLRRASEEEMENKSPHNAKLLVEPGV